MSRQSSNQKIKQILKSYNAEGKNIKDAALNELE